MQMVVPCCQCSRQLRLPREVIGSAVSCPLCKTVFLTRAIDDDHAEAIPMPHTPRHLELDADDAPLLPHEKLRERPMDALPAEDVGSYALQDGNDEPPREEKRQRRRPPSRRPREKEAEDDDGRAPRRHRGEAFANFDLFVHYDPDERLHGRFHAEADTEGLLIWRGKGRVLEVPTGAACEYLGQGKLLVAIEGRKVVVTPLHPDGLNDELAREVASFLDKQQDSFAMPERPRGKVVWLSILPLFLPLIAVIFGKAIGGVLGFFLWGFFGVALALACYLITIQRNWSRERRAWGAILISIVGFFAVGIGLSMDTSQSPPKAQLGPWCVHAPLDSGFRVEMPGRPQKGLSAKVSLPPTLPNTYYVEGPGGDTAVVAFGDAPNVADVKQYLGSMGQSLATSNSGVVKSSRDLTLDGKLGSEFHIDSQGRGPILARVYHMNHRTFAVVFVAKTLSRTGPEATRFVDSFAFDATTGWPVTR
jgi:hypothetical protein